ncbi:MAG: pseudouridine synthase [Sulfuricaulis sp.]|uniref:pseudouridine synthase n=1 Tax=Sulfuricaulis sp. TaxID=2003553 RepID=UPI003C64CEFD
MPAAEQPYPSIVEFLFRKFPDISRNRWAERIREGKVLNDRGEPITADTPYSPSKRIFYFREIENEPVIPFAEQILFQDDELLVACKPHFLPVIPGGRYVEECLLNRLRHRTGMADLVPLHRLDRETAGIVIFSVNPDTRRLYHELFMHGKVEKTYHALAEVNQTPRENQWTVANRIVRGEPAFRMKTVPGIVNACSHIQLLEVKGNRGLFSLQPVTGKTHQLRLHLSSLGFRIINDRVYPELQPQTEDDFGQPLQLLAKMIRFHDPVSGQDREFRSEREILW